MHRIDADAHVANQFSDGDAGLGLPGTTLDAAFLNAVQEEIAGTVEAAGVTLEKGTNTQLLAAIRALIGTLENIPVPRSAVSASSGDWSTTSNTFVPVPPLTVDLVTSGSRPVLVNLVPDGSAGNYPGLSTPSGMVLKLLRDGVEIGGATFYAGTDAAMSVAPGFQVIDFPPSGTHTYAIQVARLTSPSAGVRVKYCRVVAIEL